VHCPDWNRQPASTLGLRAAWLRDGSTYCLAGLSPVRDPPSLPGPPPLEGHLGLEEPWSEVLALDFRPGSSSTCAVSSAFPQLMRWGGGVLESIPQKHF